MRLLADEHIARSTVKMLRRRGFVVKITHQNVAQKLIDYLHLRITLRELVDWAESAMMEADFDARDFETLRNIVSCLGLTKVKAFGMT